MKRLLLLALITLGSLVHAQVQDPSENIRFNRAVLKYYSGNDIMDLQEHDLVAYNKVKYYFTQSFTVKDLECENCRINFNEFYNYYLFNIAEFENYRLQQGENIITYKGKYEITLLSGDALALELNGTNPQEVLHLKYVRPFPAFVMTGDIDQDYRDYKMQVRQWSVDFPEEYRTMTSARTLIKIRISDFKELTPARRDQLLSNTGNYLIVD